MIFKFSYETVLTWCKLLHIILNTSFMASYVNCFVLMLFSVNGSVQMLFNAGKQITFLLYITFTI